MSEVTPGVHKVTTRVNSFVVDGDEGVVLVDAGLPRRHGVIEEMVISLGRKLSDVVAILVTHAHVDHLGGAAALNVSTGAEVLISPIDAPAARGVERCPTPPMLKWLPGRLERMMPSPQPVDLVGLVSEGDASALPSDFSVVDSPGHTPGHVCYLLDRAGGVMFVGDTAVKGKDGSIGRGFFNRGGPDSIDSSISKLGGLDFEIAAFGHSGSIRSDASAAFAAYRVSEN